MGHIGYFRFSYTDEEEVRKILVAAPFFSDFNREHDMYNYRRDETEDPGSMPNAYASLCPFGVEFCAFGDQELIATVSDYLLKLLKARFGDVKEEW